MAIRIKSQWHDENAQRSPDEIAGAIAFIIWKTALDRAITLHGKQFVYENDKQRIDVIIEYLIFQVQIVDRMIHDMLNDEERRELITTLVLRLADHLQENSTNLLGTGNYRSPFVARLNRRSQEYAEFGFTDDGPGYPFLRHLGHEIQLLMGEGQENRWVIDQVMDRDGPEVYQQLMRPIRDLFM